MKSFKKIIPLLNRIVVKKLEPQKKTSSGIIINKQQQNTYGVIIEVGIGSYDTNGKLLPMNVKVGDKVLLPDYGGQKVKLQSQQLYIYKDSDVIARMQ